MNGKKVFHGSWICHKTTQQNGFCKHLRVEDPGLINFCQIGQEQRGKAFGLAVLFLIRNAINLYPEDHHPNCKCCEQMLIIF